MDRREEDEMRRAAAGYDTKPIVDELFPVVKRVTQELTISPQQRVLLLSRNISSCASRCTSCTSLARGSVSLSMVMPMRFLMRRTLAALAAPDPLEFQRFLQLTLDLPRAPAYPFLGRNRRSCRVLLVVESEERIVVVVECPDGGIWDRDGGDGLQLGADDVVAEVVELCVNNQLCVVMVIVSGTHTFRSFLSNPNGFSISSPATRKPMKMNATTATAGIVIQLSVATNWNGRAQQ